MFAQMEDDYLRERVLTERFRPSYSWLNLQEADASHRELTDESILIGEEISHRSSGRITC